MFRVPSDEGPRGPGALVLVFTHCLPTRLVLLKEKKLLYLTQWPRRGTRITLILKPECPAPKAFIFQFSLQD